MAISVRKISLFAVCLLPAVWALFATFEVAGQSLGANPIERLLHHFGDWGLKILIVTLAVTPARVLLKKPTLTRYRRMLGLFAFFYVSLHFLVYAVLDQRLALSPMIEDIIERPYITIGIAALLMLIPLAITSTRGWIRRLGKRWQQLHWLVYPAAIFGVWHFYWQVKQDILEPVLHAAVLALLLGFRVWHKRKRRTPPRAVAAG
ncbi:MAG: protein-methionine-sulfoxide reductase heme-binding subunit MsrQ [Pseudomonadota bacterium]